MSSPSRRLEQIQQRLRAAARDSSDTPVTRRLMRDINNFGRERIEDGQSELEKYIQDLATKLKVVADSAYNSGRLDPLLQESICCLSNIIVGISGKENLTVDEFQRYLRVLIALVSMAEDYALLGKSVNLEILSIDVGASIQFGIDSALVFPLLGVVGALEKEIGDIGLKTRDVVNSEKSCPTAIAMLIGVIDWFFRPGTGFFDKITSFIHRWSLRYSNKLRDVQYRLGVSGSVDGREYDVQLRHVKNILMIINDSIDVLEQCSIRPQDDPDDTAGGGTGGTTGTPARPVLPGGGNGFIRPESRQVNSPANPTINNRFDWSSAQLPRNGRVTPDSIYKFSLLVSKEHGIDVTNPRRCSEGLSMETRRLLLDAGVVLN